MLGAHAISYSQSPVGGVKAVTSPGIELKEVFLPACRSGLFEVPADAELGLGGAILHRVEALPAALRRHLLRPSRHFFEGPDRLPVDGNGNALGHAASVKPKNAGTFGLSAKLNVESIESTAGPYYRRFNDYKPWYSPKFTNFVMIPGVGTVPTAWQLVYRADAKLATASA